MTMKLPFLKKKINYLFDMVICLISIALLNSEPLSKPAKGSG
jgi:hypothetical protein